MDHSSLTWKFCRIIESIERNGKISMKKVKVGVETIEMNYLCFKLCKQYIFVTRRYN